MELSERLKAFGEKSEIYFGCDEDDEIWQDCGKYVLDNLPEIIAALQFAEDMEKLEDINEEVSFYDRQGEKLCSCFFQGVDYLYVGSDIYTAARKAVEAMRAAKEGA